MKSVKDKEFEDLFKNKLKDAEFNSGYLEDDWDRLELMLDKPKKQRGIVFWLPVLSSAAAILIFLGWWMFRADVAPVVKQQQQVANNSTSQVATPVDQQQKVTPQKQTPVGQSEKTKESIVNKNDVTALASDNHQKTSQVNSATRLGNTQVNVAANNRVHQNIADVSNNATNPLQLANNREHNDLITADPLIALTTTNKAGMLASIDAKPFVHKAFILPDAGVKQKSTTKKTSSSIFAQHPQFALTVLGAPEVNGVGSFGDAKSGTNVGLLFSAGIFNKLTISTGATYASMPYNTNVANYHTNYTFKTNPSQIEANCSAFDIPINVDYQLYNKHLNKFSIGTGLSSYIMTHESYDYYYADPNTKGPTSFTVPNHGKYFFGIANIQATYTRQVNSKFGVSIQPYLKLPLTDIGYSQAKLQTAGVAVGLSWNINSLTKP